MTPAQGITKLGFRRWYERELIEGHVYFVTCFLSMMLIAVCLDHIDWRGPLTQLAFTLAALMLGGALCIGSLRRYNFLLARAECFGAQSSCAQCKAYGVLQVTAAGTAEQSEGRVVAPEDNSWIRVRCKKCGHEWRMDNA
jgi:hypothetical protein